MFDDDNAQKSSTTMTLWSKYTPFKYYYLIKKRTKPTGQGLTPSPLDGQCPFKNVFFTWTPSLKHTRVHKSWIFLTKYENLSSSLTWSQVKILINIVFNLKDWPPYPIWSYFGGKLVKAASKVLPNFAPFNFIAQHHLLTHTTPQQSNHILAKIHLRCTVGIKKSFYGTQVYMGSYLWVLSLIFHKKQNTTSFLSLYYWPPKKLDLQLKSQFATFRLFPHSYFSSWVAHCKNFSNSSASSSPSSSASASSSS